MEDKFKNVEKVENVEKLENCGKLPVKSNNGSRCCFPWEFHLGLILHLKLLSELQNPHGLDENFANSGMWHWVHIHETWLQNWPEIK